MGERWGLWKEKGRDGGSTIEYHNKEGSGFTSAVVGSLHDNLLLLENKGVTALH